MIALEGPDCWKELLSDGKLGKIVRRFGAIFVTVLFSKRKIG